MSDERPMKKLGSQSAKAQVGDVLEAALQVFEAGRQYF
jgi:hypothetical protein